MDRIRQEDGLLCDVDAIAGEASFQDDDVLIGTLKVQPNELVAADNQVRHDIVPVTHVEAVRHNSTVVCTGRSTDNRALLL